MAPAHGNDDVPGLAELEAIMRSPGAVFLPEFADLFQRPAWHDRAACKGEGHERWFPGHGQPLEPAMAFCRQCPVRSECRAEVADDPRAPGVWGGESHTTRIKARRRGAA